MNTQSSDHEVHHNTDIRRFEIDLTGGDYAYARYRYLNDDSAIDILSTYVPEANRSQGLAAMVVEAAFDWAEENNLEIHTSCWYAEKKLKRRNRS